MTTTPAPSPTPEALAAAVALVTADEQKGFPGDYYVFLGGECLAADVGLRTADELLSGLRGEVARALDAFAAERERAAVEKCVRAVFACPEPDVPNDCAAYAVPFFRGVSAERRAVIDAIRAAFPVPPEAASEEPR